MCCLERREILVMREKDDATIVSGRFHLLTKPFEYSPWKPAGRTDSVNAANEGNVFEDRRQTGQRSVNFPVDWVLPKLLAVGSFHAQGGVPPGCAQAEL